VRYKASAASKPCSHFTYLTEKKKKKKKRRRRRRNRRIRVPHGVRIRIGRKWVRDRGGGFIGGAQHPRSQVQRGQDHAPRFSQTHRR